MREWAWSRETVERSKDYYAAAVCRRGHVAAEAIALEGQPPPRCSDCGAKVLTECDKCSARLRGVLNARHVTQLHYDPPDFCDHCGAPHPWASRTARLFELENILDEQDLSDADRLVVREQLQALRQPDVPEEEQQERWLRIKKLAPGIFNAGGRIVETVVSATIKSQLGL